jgi:hypothetical protein
MIWHFIRTGWPNTVAVFALAVLPLVSMVPRADLRAAALPNAEMDECASFGDPEHPGANTR